MNTTIDYDPLEAVNELAKRVKDLDESLARSHAENVKKFGEKRPDEHIDYFGGCPECGHCDACLNVNRVHFNVCHKHKKCWSPGSNLFSGWKGEDESIWRVNHMLLCTYKVAKPIHSETMQREFDAQAEKYADQESSVAVLVGGPDVPF
jgi:hypothetical protein